MYKIEAVYNRLAEYEEQFQELFAELEPQLLGDIPVSQQAVDELGRLLGCLIRHQKQWEIRNKYSLSTALFLVWCAVYYYREGNLWDPICEQLGLIPNQKTKNTVSAILGNIFLNVLRERSILKIEDTGKRYMTPILIHGYITNYGVNGFLDYLHKIYISYLGCNLSEENLEKMWSEIFGAGEEIVGFHERYAVLKAQAQELHARIKECGVSDWLAQYTPDAIEKLDNERKQLQNQLARLEQSLRQKEKELSEYKRKAEFESNGEAAAASEMHSISLTQLMAEYEEQRRVILNCRKRYQIAYARYVQVMEAVVKLDSRDVQNGFAKLREYHVLQQRLGIITGELKRLGAILQEEQGFANTTGEQAFPKSLLHLKNINPRLFQQFIRSALELMDDIWKQRPLDENHRLSHSIKNWYADRRETVKAQAEAAGLTEAGVEKIHGSTPVSIRRKKFMVRLPVLQPPVLRYKGGTMIISIPRQRLRVQEDITELPKYVMGYAGGEKILPIKHQRFGDELFLDELHAEISDLTLEGLYFRWFSFVKYWPLMLEPIMVFDNAGNLRDRDWLPNGFYYIVASNGWSTDAREIITSYPCGVPGYTVYETELIESRIVFRSRLGEGQAVINASAIRDACLVGFEHLPGVTHDGIPLGKDRGLKMIVSRKLVDSPGKYRLHLTYNGYQLYNEALDKVVEELDGEKNSTVVSLDLKKAVRARMDRQPKWEEYTIEIINELEETNYTEAICLSSGLDVAFEMNQIVLSVPKGSIIDHPDANREGHAYIFPTTGVSRINGRICVPRIGWKRFSIDVPGGTCHLVDQTGMELPMPHQFLKSEYQKLSSFSIVFKAQNALVDKVQLLDRDLNLLMEFGLKNGRAEIPLLPVIELWRNEPGDDKLYLVWTGVENSRGRFMIIEAFERLEVTDAELFVSEQADEYVIELRYKLNFVYPTKLHFRIGYQHNRGRIIFHREIEADLDYFYLRKDQLDDVYLYGEIYYVHTEESVFGIEQKEQVLWIYDFILSQWEERLKKAIDRGLILRSAQVYWNGGLKRVLFPKDKFRITQIEPSSKDIMYFEGDRLLQGVIKQDYRIDHVCFYLEEDVNRLAFLCDQDYDGAMYDPISQRLFWNDEPKHAVGPLEEIDFEFAEVVEDES